MPLNGNTYVAPTWRSDGPPALDAAGLPAISDSIVRNQGKNADQDTLIAALQTAVSGLQTGSAKIEVGSYVGTGTYGESNPCSITCRFAPKFAYIYSAGLFFSVTTHGTLNDATFWATPQNRFSTQWNGNQGLSTVTVNGNTLSWYVNPLVSGGSMNDYWNSQVQLNISGTKYGYIILG